MTRSIAVELESLFARGEMDLYDIKFEFGRTAGGELILADEISPDTCRLRDRNDGSILDKDRFRKDQGDLIEGYREVLARLEKVLEKGAQ
ncbi:MAG: phosphoribosylaminoimidazolesuccinocarboxamide synthase [Myxococcota bacterium]